MKTVYLCGGINKLSDSDANDWRAAVKEQLGAAFVLLDPMRRDYRGLEAQSVEVIVRGDLDDIKHSDIILVNAVRPSWGTAMELFFAAGQGKKIVTVCPEEHPSPWLVRYSDVVLKSFGEAFSFLQGIQ